MKWISFFSLFCATFYVGATSNCPQTIDVDTSPVEGLLGTMLQVLLDRLDDMERKLSELQTELREHREEVERNRIPDCVSPTSATPPPDSTTPTTLTTTSTTQSTVTKPPNYVSCKNAPANVSGVYLIRINDTSAPFKVYCEMESFDGGWIVVQHRFDGTVDFFRRWFDYRNGFGEVDKEFWLGLEHIHQLTTVRAHEIVIEMKDFSGNYGYARYNAFQVGDENEQYILKTLGSYNGTAGDSLVQHKGRMFSTKDRDNDESPLIWASICESGWWHGVNDAYSNLNGRYVVTNVLKSNFWISFKEYRGMRFTRMMIREV
ncbi:fibrinogen-like protein A [Anopheles aquasalis]|uniref:fibrinogen-like protein A n=1 Tax=Anopheles aquasalis TaxID=42839 RepID=UPI00215B7165|nr:fibrinogen-like protein A [Anopheles aquasalis]